LFYILKIKDMVEEMTVNSLPYMRIGLPAYYDSLKSITIDILTPDVVQILGGLGGNVDVLVAKCTEMSHRNALDMAFAETSDILTQRICVRRDVVGIGAALDFYASNAFVSETEREAAITLKSDFKMARKSAYRDAIRCINSVDNAVRRILEPDKRDLVVAVHLLAAFEQLKADNDRRRELIDARNIVKRRRCNTKTMVQLRKEAEPHRRRVFADLEYLAINGSEAQKPVARHAIFQINASQRSIRQQYHFHNTELRHKAAEAGTNAAE
jgi:hypothetical protein